MGLNVVAYTDGSANWVNKLGGFGVYITYVNGKEIVKEEMYSVGLENTTVGRAELKGAIHCLQSIDDVNLSVEIHCDSEYVVKCITERRLWIWKRHGWLGIKNPDLIMQFYEEYIKFRRPPVFKHIKGHTKLGDIHSLGNQIVDKLADYKRHKHYKRDII